MENVWILGGLRSFIGVKDGIYRHIPAEVLGAQVLKEIKNRFLLKNKRPGKRRGGGSGRGGGGGEKERRKKEKRRKWNKA